MAKRSESTRQDVLKRAEELIKSNPYTGKDAINKQLRKEYGHGLRRIEVAKLKRRISRYTPEQLRYHKKQITLIKEGFLPIEAKEFAKYPIARPGIQKIRRFRKSEIRNAVKAGIPKRHIKTYIRDSYQARGLVNPRGIPSPKKWVNAVYDEVVKPYKQRQPVLISPAKYKDFRIIKQYQLNASENFDLIMNLPAHAIEERISMYRRLRTSFFTHEEALTIVNARIKGTNQLQSLDLSSEVWQQAMTARKMEFWKIVNQFEKKGFSRAEALIAARGAIRKRVDADKVKYSADKEHYDGNLAFPYDYIKEYYKKQKKQVDYQEASDRGSITTKMPGRVK